MANFRSNHKKWKESSNKKIYNDMKKHNKKKNSIINEDYDAKTYLERISERLKLPNDMFAGAAILTSTGRNQICIENYKGIIEYTGDLIKVQTKTCRISIEGKNLNIDYFTNDEMRISGHILSIHYLS